MQTVYLDKHGNSVFVSVFVPFGSYYETDKTRGIAHFIEHLLFKGTITRTRKDIDYAIEKRGGDINAFTDFEQTCYHITIAKQYKEEAIDILTDMVTNPLFPKKEIEKEKEVIIQELKMYKDRPNDVLCEYSNSLFYPKGNGFHYPVGGTIESVSAITREDIIRVHKEHYKNPILIVVGESSKPFCNNADTSDFPKSHSVSCYKKKYEEYLIKPELEQAKVLISSEIYNKKYSPTEQFFLNNLLNSIYNDMSGRLFETIREKRHLVYGVSFGTTQRSSGMIEWSVSLGLDKNKIKTARRLVEKELVRPVTKAELKFAIEKTIGTFALCYDANGSIGDLIASSLRVGIDWQEAYYNYEHNIIKAGKQLNDYIKILNFKENILVGLIGKK